LWVLKIAHRKHVRTDFQANYVKQAIPRKDVPFFGQGTNSIFPESPFWGVIWRMRSGRKRTLRSGQLKTS